MSGQYTTLILGAGSNCQFGFPSGSQLTEYIKKHLATGESAIRKRLTHLFDESRVNNFVLELIRSQRASVDSFLQARTDFIDIGRCAIAGSILHYEFVTGGDRISSTSVPRMYQLNENWYAYLLDRLGNSIDEIKNTNLRIVTFNYDRSLEEYLITDLPRVPWTPT